MMNKDEKLEEVKKAMRNFGRPDSDRIALKDLDDIRSQVFCFGVPFGIYDFAKHTFVD